jgi:hypothetical protein
MNKQRFAVVIAGTVVFFSMLIINMLQIGNREFITSVNNLTMLGFGVLATAQALIYWRSLENREEAKRVWLVLGLGMGFYSLGQLTWMAYNLIGVDVPYPSLGDLFWVVAYPFLFISIINKILLLGILPDKGQIAAGAVLGVIFFLLIGDLILLPMLEYVQIARVVETLLNFFYPIMDFLILVAVSFLVIILWKGKLSVSWNVIAAGFLCLAVADVLFIYATWNELYYVEGGSLNLLTRSVDVAYTLAIFLLALGAYLHQWVVMIQPETIEFGFAQTILAEQSKPQPRRFTTEMQAVFNKIFFMVDGDQNVYFFSQNYRELCQMLGHTSDHAVGVPLHSVLGIDRQIVRKIFSDIQPGKTSVVPVEILIGAQHIPAVLRVAPARNGCDVFLRYRHADKPIVIEEQKSIEIILVEETLRSVQGLESSSMDMRGATAFFLIEVQEMYLFLVRMGGYRVGQVLVEKFNQMAGQNAKVRIMDGRVVLTDTLDTGSMSNLLQLTLRTVQELTSTEATRKVVKHLNEKIPEGIIRAAQNVGLAL